MSAALWREFGEEVAALDGALSSARSSVVRSFDVDATAGIDGAADALRRCADALVAVAERMRASPIARCAWFPVKLTCRHWGSCDCADKAMRVAVVVPVVAEVVEVKPPRRELRVVAHAGTAKSERQAAAWMANRPAAIEGQGGHDHTRSTAWALARMGLTWDQAWPLLEQWNSTCSPPWSQDDLAALLISALSK
jgi:hypothetical protein